MGFVAGHLHPENISLNFFNNKIVNNDLHLNSFENFVSSNSSNFFKIPNADLSIIADASLTNKLALIKELYEKYPVIPPSDSEIILRAYQTWGVTCLDKLIGDFAFAIMDKNKLLIASDCIGQRTLYYAKNQRNFYFSNVPLILFDVYGIKKNYHQQKIAEQLALVYSESQNTFYEDVKRIPPGYFLIINHKLEIHLNRYWSAEKIYQEPHEFSDTRDYHENFKELFFKVIAEKISITSDYGCHLSGGLDSSSIVSVIANLEPHKKINTFSYVPSIQHNNTDKFGWNYQDKFYIEKMQSKYPNILVNYVEDCNKKFFEDNALFHRFLDAPFLNPSNLIWITSLLDLAKSMGVKTLFTGQAGNFTISWRGITKTKLSLKKFIQSSKGEMIKWMHGKRINQPWRNYSAIDYQFSKNQSLQKRFKHFYNNKDARILVFDQGLIASAAAFNTAVRIIYGIEHWDPTSDRRIVEFCLKTPNPIFQQSEQSRLLVRNSMRGILPDEICNRTTQGMQSADWFHKLELQKNEISELLNKWKNTFIADYLDLNFLLKLLKNWDFERVANSRNRQYYYFETQYKLKLLRAIETGLFLESYI